MKQNDFQGHEPTKMVMCTMAVLFFVGIFLVGAGVNMAWHQRTGQTAERAQINQQEHQTRMGAGRTRYQGWKTGHFRRRHRHHKFQALDDKDPINANVPMSKFKTW